MPPSTRPACRRRYSQGSHLSKKSATKGDGVTPGVWGVPRLTFSSSAPGEALRRQSIYMLTVSSLFSTCFAGLALVELAVLVVALESLDRLLPSDGPALGRLSRPELRASDAACRKLPPPSPAEARPSDAARRKLPPLESRARQLPALGWCGAEWLDKAALPALPALGARAARRKLPPPELRASDAACRKLPPPSSAEVRPSDAAGRKLPPRRASRAESADLVLPKSSWVLRCLRPALTGVAPGLFAIVVASIRWITLPCTPVETPDAAAALSAPLRSWPSCCRPLRNGFIATGSRKRSMAAESADLVLTKSSSVLGSPRPARPALTGLAPGLVLTAFSSIRWILRAETGVSGACRAVLTDAKPESARESARFVHGALLVLLSLSDAAAALSAPLRS